MTRIALMTAATLGLTSAFAFAGDEQDAAGPTLGIGDKAPAIDIAHWIKGVDVNVKENKMTPITEFEAGKVYVLEFWATWCSPCRAGMPHLSELQEKYKGYDVTIIGVSDEQLPTVVNFLFDTDPRDGKVQNERTNYVLATDPDESVKNDYFRAAGQRAIPSAFIIGKDTRVEWIGHPMEMDEPLAAVVRDAWDRDAFAMSRKKAMQAEMKLAEAYKSQDWDTVLGIFDERLAEDPDSLQYMLNKFNVLLLNANRPADAYAFGAKLVERSWDEAGVLNAVAWTVADDKRVEKRDLAFALKAAERANELTGSKDPAILDTLARVHYENGDIWKALKWQRKAAEFAGEGAMGDGIRESLAKYEDEAKF